jgi:hypothetical protein
MVAMHVGKGMPRCSEVGTGKLLVVYMYIMFIDLAYRIYRKQGSCFFKYLGI